MPSARFADLRPPSMGPEPSPEDSTTSVLPSGRTLVIRAGREEIEVRAPGGALEVTIAFDAHGPVVRLSGGRLELDAANIAVRCDELAVSAKKTRLSLEDELTVRAAGDVRVNGAMIRLNCTE